MSSRSQTTRSGRGRGRGRGQRLSSRTAARGNQEEIMIDERNRNLPTVSEQREEEGSVHREPMIEENIDAQESVAAPRSCGERTVATTRKSNEVRKRRLELRAAEEKAKIQRATLREMERLEIDLIDKRLALELAEAGDEEDERHTIRSASISQKEMRSRRSVEEWLAGSEVELDRQPERDPVVGVQVTSTPREDLPSTSKNSGIHELTQVLTETIQTVRDSAVSANNTDRVISRLTSARDLPLFSGDGLEWLRFKIAFSQAMERGAYTEDEKVTRLYNCLRGEARDAVASLMLTTSRVNDVMEILELRFGNPDTTLRKVVQEVKLLPKLTECGIVIFATKVKNCVAAMQAMKHIGYLHSPELLTDVVNKMPAAMLPLYNRYIQESDKEEPRLVRLSQFLFQEANFACQAGTSDVRKRKASRILEERPRKQKREMSTTAHHSALCNTERVAKGNQKVGNKTFRSARKDAICTYCHSKQHRIERCAQFADYNVDRRWQWAKKKGICFRCLASNHKRSSCSADVCGRHGCRRPHHELLHRAEKNKTSSDTQSMADRRPESDGTDKRAVTNTWIRDNKRILLKVIPVTLQGPRGRVSTYALLDEGSSITLIDQDMADRIGAKGPKDTLVLHGARGMMTADSRSERVSLNIIDNHNKRHHELVEVRTMKDLELPQQSLRAEDISGHDHLKGLTIEFYAKAHPTILLGQDNWHLIVSLEIRSAKRNAPVASRTELGWVLHGYAGTIFRYRPQHLDFHLRAGGTDDQEGTEKSRERDEIQNLHDLVKTQFKLEAIGVMERDRPNAYLKRAEQILRETTRRVGECWETGLLWKDDAVKLPDNRSIALFRLKSLERKLDKDPALRTAYCEQIKNLIQKEYARKITDAKEMGPWRWYLPHFGVSNPQKPNKLRVVFDAAAKMHGIGLNDVLLPGPDLLKSLLGVLMRFRQKPVAIAADIQEMFLRVKIRPQDHHVQYFLWRDMDRDREPDTYVMTSMIFGATSSPCSAQYVKNRNAQEFTIEFPQAVRAICHKHYVDDYLDSVDSEEDAKKLIREVTEVHKRGGFNIRGWSSNRKAVLESLAPETLATAPINLALEDQYPAGKTLGLKWNQEADTFSFDINLSKVPVEVVSGKRKPTKREMLRVIMSVFDPHGFLTPYTIRSKTLLQNVWKSGIGWDDQLKAQESAEWEGWIKDLHLLQFSSIPRCYVKYSGPLKDLQLHVFCDASEQAAATVAYWRMQYDSQIVDVAFIGSKSRVAPLKPLSIPRLELQAALLASRFAHFIEAEHEIKTTKRVFWSDSQTVLSWIRGNPRTYKAFVAHRLGEIDELTDGAEWRWVPTSENPADDATRSTGKVPNTESRWFKGPNFLYGPETQWPKPRHSNTKDADLENQERRSHLITQQVETLLTALPLVERFSSWKRLIRATAWMLLFIERCHKKQKTELTTEHVSRAEALWTKSAQQTSFAQELAALRKTNCVSNDSRLRHLTPVLDSHGILRVQGRVERACGIERETMSPAILDGQHRYTRLLVLHYHQQAGHGSTEMVVNEIRQRYWIIKLRPTIRSVCYRCQLCRVKRAKPQTTRMGDLPAARLSHHRRPFTCCGLDYFGPMEVTIGRRHEKRWGVLFTCLTTRAIHLELASSLTTDSAIMALRRMAARRGYPSEIYSDNGTNLRGADVELRRALKQLNTDDQKAIAAKYGMTWHFIPPNSPHMGGSWERMIRTVKVALKTILRERAPREETLATLLAEVEHTVNSRPLTHVSVDHRDMESLTPNHFLIGTSSGTPIPGKFSEADLLLKKQWRVAQCLADLFWSRWVKEYLPILLPRKCWLKETTAPVVGTVVIIADHTQPRNVWPKGIITATFPGRDGRIRVVDVKTKGGVLRRPVTKIVPIPIDP